MFASRPLTRLRDRLADPRVRIGGASAQRLALLALWTALGQVAALTAVLLLTRTLGPAGFGSLAFALTVQAYLLTLGTAGARPLALQEVARDPSEETRVAAAYLLLGTVGGALLAFLVPLLVTLAPHLLVDEARLLVIIAIGNAFAVLSPQPLFDARHRQPLPVAVGALSEVLALAALFLLRERLSLLLVGAIFASKWLLASAAQWTIWFRTGQVALSRRTIRDAQSLAIRSLPVLGATLLGLVPHHAGVLAVRALNDSATAGLFGVAQFAGQSYVVFALLGVGLLQPHIAVLQLDRSRFWRQLFPAGVAYFLLLAALFGAAVLGAIEWLLPPAFAAAALPAALMLLSGTVLTAAALLAHYALRLGRARFGLYASLAALLAWLAVTLAVVPPLGALGAALASLLFAAVRFGVLLLTLRKPATA